MSYFITFRRMGAVDDSMICLPNRWKLLWWMITTGLWCKAVLIFLAEDGDDGEK